MGEHPCLAPECERVFKSPMLRKGHLLTHLKEDDPLGVLKTGSDKLFSEDPQTTTISSDRSNFQTSPEKEVKSNSGC